VSGGALLVAGTTSDAGKSVVTAGLCRAFARRGLRVAPFKAQNMSLNSFVTLDGGEIGRAQAMQAAAAGVEPEAAMNPVLLKPGGERRSHVVVLGQSAGAVSALSYRERKAQLADVVARSLADLRSRFDVVVCEGAGSPAEINLRGTDIANMGLARSAGLPVLVVGDIDRGGVFASMFGTLALLDAADQAHVAGFVVNKFRGDPALLSPGLRMLEDLTSRPVYGVLPWQPGLWLDVEDSLDLEADRGTSLPPAGRDVLRVSVLRLPRMSNATDLDALAAEPGVLVRFASRAEECADADLVVVPGTRATVEDLAWLRERGLDAVLQARAVENRPVLGICGGYQMLGRVIVDEVESSAGEVAGLGLLPLATSFAADRLLARPHGRAGDLPVSGYEIHHGRIAVEGGEPLVSTETGPEGCRVGATWGSVWHGLLENDGYRRRFLHEVAAAAGRSFVVGDVSFASVRQTRLDALGDLVESALDIDAVLDLAASGPPPDLPFVPPGAPLAPRKESPS
jgi:adenosylcobyric acid synthase